MLKSNHSITYIYHIYLFISRYTYSSQVVMISSAAAELFIKPGRFFPFEINYKVNLVSLGVLIISQFTAKLQFLIFIRLLIIYQFTIYQS